MSFSSAISRTTTPAHKKLVRRQATLTAAAALIMGLALACSLIYVDVKDERESIDTLASQLLNAVYQSAAQAAYQLDGIGAQKIIDGLAEVDHVQKVVIIDDFGLILGRTVKRSDPESPGLISRLAFPEPLIYSVTLTAAGRQQVGRLEITMDRAHLVEHIVEHSPKSIVGLPGGDDCPVGRVHHPFLPHRDSALAENRGRAVGSGPGTAGFEIIGPSPDHEDDELGLIVRNINLLLEGFSESQERHREAELKVLESEKRHRQLFENAPVGIITVGENGQIMDVNPRLVELLGSPSAEATRSINMFSFPPLVEAGISANFQECLRTGRIGIFETPYVSKWGREVFLRYNIEPIRDEGGRVVLVQGIMEDISEAKNLEIQLQHAQKMEAVGTLAGGIAHDFNNILQVIQGYTQLLLFEQHLNSDDQSSLNAIQSAAGRAAELTRQLLTFSRKVESRLEPADINRVIEDAGAILRGAIPKMIDLDLILSDDLEMVRADPVQIEQVILNLGVNAKDAMPDGGKIIIETRKTYLDEEYCRRHLEVRPGPYVLVAVTDTGQGISPETAKHIFEPFFTTKEVGQGSGLGLAMVYGIIKNHQGHITCHSEPGRGTVFSIFLPASDQVTAAAVVAAPASSDQEIEPGRGDILVVDDEEWIRDMASKMLSRFGYSVRTAPDGETALDLYQSEDGRPDLVLLDLGMPGMGGLKCLQKLKTMDPEARVIVASGYSIDEESREIIQADASHFLHKPYQAKELMEAVRKVVGVRAEAGE